MCSVNSIINTYLPALSSPLHERPSIDQKLQRSKMMAWLHKYGADFKADASQEGSNEWHWGKTLV